MRIGLGEVGGFWGGKLRFWLTVVGNGQLFHVEQFEIASKDAP